MKRDFEQYLEQWKSSPNRKPMVIRGARQVGKTYIVDKFGRSQFENYLKINVEQDERVKEVFRSKNPQLIINELSVLYNIPIIAGSTLLFIDEIQASPEAIGNLRYFYEEMPDLHIIATGSLLDHTLNKTPYSMPVGRVEFAYLYPLNFKEFLFVNGEKALVLYLNDFSIEQPFSTVIHDKLLAFLRLYFFIGGMPEAVRVYIKTKNLIEVEKVHSSILTSLKYDFAKYGSRSQQDYLKDCLSYCAMNVGNKVKYVNINKNVRATYLKDAILKLELSRVVHLVRRTKSSKVPINQHLDNNTFKPIFIDIGLSCHLAKIKLTDLNNLITDFEGILAEQFVGQELLASSPFYEDSKLFYWIRESKNTNAEIDFLYQVDNLIYPLEVKSGKTGTLKSLQVYLAEKKQEKGIRLNIDIPNVGDDLQATVYLKGQKEELSYQLYSFPLYMADQISTLVRSSSK